MKIILWEIIQISDIPLKFSSSFGKLFASQAGVSRTGLAMNGAFSTSLLLPSEEEEKKHTQNVNALLLLSESEHIHTHKYYHEKFLFISS